MTLDETRKGPLAGVRILDLTAVVSGPFATMMLADQGADVVKVEPLGHGDHGRFIGPGFEGYSALFATCNRNKRSLALDLQSPAGAEAVRTIAAQVDVLIENFRPGVSDRLGVGYEQIRALNPEIIYASITGFGPEGPYAEQRTYDAVVQAVSGMADSQSGGGKEPALISSIICDKVAGMTAAQAISAALFARARGAGGQRISISMLEASLAFNWPDVMWNQTFASPEFVPGQTLAETYRLWKTRDGHLAIVFITDRAFAAWCRALDAPAEILAERFASEPESRVRWRELASMWEARLADLTTEDALARFHREGVPAGAVRTRERLFEDPQVVHSQTIAEIADGSRGVIRLAKPGARFADHPFPSPSRAPEVGEHSREILQSFGLSAGAVDELIADGVVALNT